MYKPEYKTGDRVVIKPWKLMEEQYGLNNVGYIKVAAAFSLKMEKRLKGTDRVVTLGEVFREKFFNGTGHLKGFYISPDAILGYAFECGDEIEVSNTGIHWSSRVFSGYDPMSQDEPVRGNSFGSVDITLGWKFARPVQKRIIVKFFNERGEDITESISEETKRKLLIDN